MLFLVLLLMKPLLWFGTIQMKLIWILHTYFLFSKVICQNVFYETYPLNLEGSCLRLHFSFNWKSENKNSNIFKMHKGMSALFKESLWTQMILSDV